MPAHRAIGMIYDLLTRRLSDDRRLEIDAILGDEDAKAEIVERRTAAIVAAGFEVG